MNVITCEDCGVEIPQSRVENGYCFACWVGVGSEGPIVQWRGGGGYTREDFHARTNREFIAENDGPDTIKYEGR